MQRDGQENNSADRDNGRQRRSLREKWQLFRFRLGSVWVWFAAAYFFLKELFWPEKTPGNPGSASFRVPSWHTISALALWLVVAALLLTAVGLCIGRLERSKLATGWSVALLLLLLLAATIVLIIAGAAVGEIRYASR